jgi:hypothetical protein
MALPITIPNTFATQSGPIPLTQLDTNFTTVANGVNGIGSGSNALTTPVLGNATATTLTASGSIKSSSSSGIGYSTGAGSTVTQATSKSTGVTINYISGQITTSNAALTAGSEVVFTVTNSAIASTDVVIINHASGGTAGSYSVEIAGIATGSFGVCISNLSTSNRSEAITLNYAIIKAVNA